MRHGTIQTLHATRGFGFLRDTEGVEVFFHRRALTPPERLAKDRADGAVTAVLVPICVERFMGQAEAAAKLAEFQRSASWQQSQLIEQGGWATTTGSKDPNAAEGRGCAPQLPHPKTEP